MRLPPNYEKKAVAESARDTLIRTSEIVHKACSEITVSEELDGIKVTCSANFEDFEIEGIDFVHARTLESILEVLIKKTKEISIDIAISKGVQKEGLS